MSRALLTRSISFLALATFLFANSASAEPITVTSGLFAIPDDGPSFFRFFGADGFVLRAGFVPVPVSTQITCDVTLRGCAPGTVINLSAVAGGTSPLFNSPFTLGNSFDSNVNGTPFFTFPSPQGRLAGTFRFDAPSVVLSSVPEGATTGPGFSAPFVFEGQVRGFAAGDVNLRAPLFDVELVGQGTLSLGFDTVFNGSFSTVEERFTFSATPEPTTIVLFGTGLVGVVARTRTGKKRRLLLARTISR
jgi:hypothetical protein